MKKSTAAIDDRPIEAAGLTVTVGHNAAIGQVVLVFGDVNDPDMKYITLTPDAAEQISGSLQQNADKARGRKAS